MLVARPEHVYLHQPADYDDRGVCNNDHNADADCTFNHYGDRNYNQDIYRPHNHDERHHDECRHDNDRDDQHHHHHDGLDWRADV